MSWMACHLVVLSRFWPVRGCYNPLCRCSKIRLKMTFLLFHSPCLVLCHSKIFCYLVSRLFLPTLYISIQIYLPAFFLLLHGHGLTQNGWLKIAIIITVAVVRKKAYRSDLRLILYYFSYIISDWGGTESLQIKMVSWTKHLSMFSAIAIKVVYKNLIWV